MFDLGQQVEGGILGMLRRREGWRDLHVEEVDGGRGVNK